uniref:Uncharacterized protein n=1 Tax=Micrurus surinamensis TaxID=129470 RepID=A0A2D4NPK4_MICSU
MFQERLQIKSKREVGNARPRAERQICKFDAAAPKSPLAKSRSACFRCRQKVTEERECSRVTGSPCTNSFMNTLKIMTPFTSHKIKVGIIQPNQPPDSDFIACIFLSEP